MSYFQSNSTGRSSWGLSSFTERSLGSLKCPVCENGYATSQSLERHLQHHLNFGILNCEFCTRSFKVPYQRREHVRKEHFDQWESYSERKVDDIRLEPTNFLRDYPEGKYVNPHELQPNQGRVTSDMQVPLSGGALGPSMQSLSLTMVDMDRRITEDPQPAHGGFERCVCGQKCVNRKHLFRHWREQHIVISAVGLGFECYFCKTKILEDSIRHQARHEINYLKFGTPILNTIGNSSVSLPVKVPGSRDGIFFTVQRSKWDKRFRCSVPNCVKRYSAKTSLNRHMEIAHYGYMRQQDWEVPPGSHGNNTMGTVNYGTAVYKCPHCLYECKSRSGQVCHIRLKHPQEYYNSMRPATVPTLLDNLETQGGRSTDLRASDAASPASTLPSSPISTKSVTAATVGTSSRSFPEMISISDNEDEEFPEDIKPWMPLIIKEEPLDEYTPKGERNAVPPINLYLCSHRGCTKSFENPDHLKRHQELHKRVVKNRCILCEKICFVNGRKISEEDTATASGTFIGFGKHSHRPVWKLQKKQPKSSIGTRICQKCRLGFESFQKKNVEAFRPSTWLKLPVKCILCNSTGFESEDSLKAHLRQVHSESGFHRSCQVCLYPLNCPLRYYDHYRAHQFDRERPIPCNATPNPCQQQFKNKQHLEEHILSDHKNTSCGKE